MLKQRVSLQEGFCVAITDRQAAMSFKRSCLLIKSWHSQCGSDIWHWHCQALFARTEGRQATEAKATQVESLPSTVAFKIEQVQT